MTALDWLWILHPALAVVVVYPLLGVVMSLAWQTRQRRVAKQKQPPTVGRDHSDVGRWLAASVVWLVLIARQRPPSVRELDDRVRASKDGKGE